MMADQKSVLGQDDYGNYTKGAGALSLFLGALLSFARSVVNRGGRSPRLDDIYSIQRSLFGNVRFALCDDLVIRGLAIPIVLSEGILVDGESHFRVEGLF